MPVSNVSAGQQILASDVNTHINQTNTNTSNISTLQSQMSTANSNISSIQDQLSRATGHQEHGSYLLSQGCHASGDFVSLWINTLSKGNSIASVSIDQSIGAATNCNSPTTAHLNQYGFQVNTTSTAATSNATVGGNFTATF